MSHTTSVNEPLQLLIDEDYTLTILRYGFIVGSFLLANDIIITLDVEIAQIWKQKFTGATVLYLLIRYIYPITQVMEIIFSSYPLSDQACTGLARTKDILKTFVATSAATLIFTFRTWAIFQRSKIVLIIVGLFGAAKIAANIVGLVTTESYSTSGAQSAAIPPATFTTHLLKHLATSV